MRKNTPSSNLRIKKYAFDDTTPSLLKQDMFFYNWPIVYVLNNDEELYIGETYHSCERMKQHLNNPDRRRLDKCRIFASKDFTKSSTLDIESSLIELCSAENLKTLQNTNPGIVKHEYAHKELFSQESKLFKKIWDDLYKDGLVKSDISSLQNSEIFTYSPYKSLTPDQCECRNYIIEDVKEAFEKNTKKSIFVNGSAGTGKSILALYLLKLFLTGADYECEEEDIKNFSFINTLKEAVQIKGRDLKVGYVVAMESFRTTLQSVLRQMSKKEKKLKGIKILNPSEVFKENYDILIVDEAHRLKQTRALSNEIGKFYNTNIKHGFDMHNANHLDWIIKQSQVQILFYDSHQSIRPSDIDRDIFINLIRKSNVYSLSTQMRCKGGREYIRYVEDILNEKANKLFTFENNYEFYLYKDINDFCKKILEKEKEFSFSRIVSGYGFKWLSNPRLGKEALNNYDIVIGNRKFQWNKTKKKWPITINGNRVIEEVGCIHTIQGYDCNYCGVIFGPEIYYDGKHIKVDRSKYFDDAGKKTVKNDNELLEYIKNIYSVLLTRGIKGTYVYVCDDLLRDYLSKYIKTI